MILFVFFFTQFEFYNDLPRGIHQWAQADRYAVAERFLEDRSFWKPATYSIISNDGEVGVEFPIIQFIAASVASTFNLRNYLPFIYRFLTFLILFTGFYALIRHFFRRYLEFTLIALGITLFCSPLLLFYGYNFSNDAAACGLVLLSLSLYLKNSNQNISLVLIIAALACLIKTSSGIYFIAIAGTHIIQNIRQFNKGHFWGVILLTIGLSGFIVYYDYLFIVQRNKVLWSTLFLSQPNPIESFADLKQVIKGLWSWKWEYFNKVQWLLIVIGIAAIVKKKALLKASGKTITLAVLLTLGLASILILFGKGFVYHDYYFIATFYPTFILLFAKGMQLFLSSIATKFRLLLILTFGIISFSLGSNQHFDRMSDSVVIDQSYFTNNFAWLQDLDKSIDKVASDTAKVFVVYQDAPNLALVYMHRKGIVFNHEEMGREESNFYYWLDRRRPDYVLCRLANLDKFREEHSVFLKGTTAVLTTSEFTLFKINGY